MKISSAFLCCTCSTSVRQIHPQLIKHPKFSPVIFSFTCQLQFIVIFFFWNLLLLTNMSINFCLLKVVFNLKGKKIKCFPLLIISRYINIFIDICTVLNFSA